MVHKSPTHDGEYKPTESKIHLEPCPVCGSGAEVWRYSEGADAPSSLTAMCSNGTKFGPQDGLVNEGCLLYLPPDCFYRGTIREAAKYWNEYAIALTDLRESNAKHD